MDASTFDCQLSTDLETVQQGIDAINALPERLRAAVDYFEWYLHQRKALLERHIPAGGT